MDQGKDRQVIIGRKRGPTRSQRPATHKSKIIPAAEVESLQGKVRIIGGDTSDFNQKTPPSIIIDKVNDQISKIVVKCPCGRHAELRCEYEK